jgi:tetratricopeptide (TPR) repeat protein
MNDAGNDSVPRWVEPYVPHFVSIERTLDRIEGFILMPIELPSRDLALALGDWLQKKGHATRTIRPSSKQEWDALAAALLGARGSPGSVTLVIGTDQIEQIHRGLRLLNQRRDSVVRRLGRPLLWCGPAQFFETTWQDAPDFWSIADVPRRFSVEHKRIVKSSGTLLSLPMEAPKSTAELQDLYRMANDQGDRANAARIGVDLVEKLVNASQLPSARVILADIEQDLERIDDPDLHLRALLTSARIAMTTGDLSQAETHLLSALTLASGDSNSMIRARALLTLGEIYSQLGRHNEAVESLRRAIAILDAGPDKYMKARTLLALGEVAWQTGRMGEAEVALREALTIYRSMDWMERGRAHALLALGRVLLDTTRLSEAEASFAEALSLSVEDGDTRGKAVALEELAHHAHVRGDEPLAFNRLSQALSLRRELGDGIEATRDLIQLVRTAVAAGYPLRAIALAGRELAVPRAEDQEARMMLLTMIADALDTVKEQGSSSARFLAWVLARERDDPSAASRAEALATQLADFDPEASPKREAIDAHQAQLVDAVMRCEARVRGAGGDPQRLPELPP